MQSDIVQRLDYWRSEMQRTIKALESNPKFADVVEGNRAIHTTLGMAKTEILFSRTTIANQSEAMRASDAELARLTEALRAAEERASLTIPSDIAKAVAAIGQVEWGATDEEYAAGHGASVQKSVEMTAVHFNQTGPQPMHGVYIKGDDIVVCHTGTSPNSGQHARAIVGAWNFMLQHANAALKEQPHADA